MIDGGLIDGVSLTDLIDGTLSGPEWDQWLATHPEAATEVQIGRRVRAIVTRLQSSNVTVPADFEARLLERVRKDQTLLDLLEIMMSGAYEAILELMNVLFALQPGSARAAPSPA